jgi:hypothetical protein
MSAHTPGPWVVEPGRRQDGAPQTFRVVSLPDKRANEWRKDWYAPSLVHGLSEADANLIAAAPELVAALKALLVAVPEDPFLIEATGRTEQEAIQAHAKALAEHRAVCATRLARAAIAKAEGKS